MFGRLPDFLEQAAKAAGVLSRTTRARAVFASKSANSDISEARFQPRLIWGRLRGGFDPARGKFDEA